MKKQTSQFLDDKSKCQLLSRVWLCVIPRTAAHQAPLAMGILQARILEWVAILFSRGSSRLRDRTQASCIRQLLHHMSHKGSWTTSSKHPWPVTGSLLRKANCMPGDRNSAPGAGLAPPKESQACVLQAAALQNCSRWWKSERYRSAHHWVTKTQRNTEGWLRTLGNVCKMESHTELYIRIHIHSVYMSYSTDIQRWNYLETHSWNEGGKAAKWIRFAVWAHS